MIACCDGIRNQGFVRVSKDFYNRLYIYTHIYMNFKHTCIIVLVNLLDCVMGFAAGALPRLENGACFGVPLFKSCPSSSVCLVSAQAVQKALPKGRGLGKQSDAVGTCGYRPFLLQEQTL